MPPLRIVPAGPSGRGDAVTTGHLLEVFSSYQGEGPYAGARQIFVRFGGCHLRCAYCDTPESWDRAPAWRLESPPESRTFDRRPNPVEAADVLAVIREWSAARRYHSVSFTGGEPVLQPAFLRELADGARALGLPTYLDTSGTLSERLAEASPAIDIFAFDVKLPSCPGVRLDWDDVRRCLEHARGRDAFAKIVVLEDSDPAEVARAARLVRMADPAFRIVLQPVTPTSDASAPPSGTTLARLRAACEAEGVEPLVLPQLHKLAGWL